MIVILNGRIDAWRIGRYVVLQRHGNIDQLSRHGASSRLLVLSGRGIVKARRHLLSSCAGRPGGHAARAKLPRILPRANELLIFSSYFQEIGRAVPWCSLRARRRRQHLSADMNGARIGLAVLLAGALAAGFSFLRKEAIADSHRQARQLVLNYTLSRGDSPIIVVGDSIVEASTLPRDALRSSDRQCRSERRIDRERSRDMADRSARRQARGCNRRIARNE